MPDDRRTFRTDVLASYGANSAQLEELLAYNDNVFDRAGLSAPLRFPLPDEPFVAAWERYVEEAEKDGIEQCFQRRFPQFSFPVAAGISRTEEYRAATRRGILPEPLRADRVRFERPEGCRIVVHPSAAGRIALILTGNRGDFVTCVQVSAHRNEPVDIPESMGACMVAGFNNWDRIRRLTGDWVPQKHLYQDRFIILSDGPYSGVPEEELGLPPGASLVIRREHECTHYFTWRVFGSMRNHLLDELIADYTGIVAAAGTFRAGWLLRFLADRLEIYRGGLSGGAFAILRKLLESAAGRLEEFHREPAKMPRAVVLILLTQFTLEELASPGFWQGREEDHEKSAVLFQHSG